MRPLSLMKIVLSIALISLICSALDSDLANGSANQQRYTASSVMTNLSLGLFNSLSPSQLKVSSFQMNSKQMSEWRYFPSPSLQTQLILPDHHGMAMSQMNEQQKEALHQILQTGLSSIGQDALSATMTLEKDNTLAFRGLVDWMLFNYSPDCYFISFFGQPSDAQWAFRFEGHHVSLTFTISNTDGKMTVSPAFIGTTMNKVLIATKDGQKQVEPLKPVVDSIRAVAGSLTEQQFQLATQSLKKVPMFNLFAPRIFGGPLKIDGTLPKGLKISGMTEAQKQNVLGILTGFKKNFNNEAAVNTLSAITATVSEDLELVWAGDYKMEKPFYHCVTTSF